MYLKISLGKALLLVSTFHFFTNGQCPAGILAKQFRPIPNLLDLKFTV